MIRINLLSPEKKKIKRVKAAPAKESKKKKEIPPSRLIILLFIVVVGALYYLQNNAIKKEQDLLHYANNEKQKLRDVSSKLEKTRQLKESIDRKINLIKQLQSEQSVAVNILDELSANIPEWVWLHSANYENNSIQLKGKSLSMNLTADYIYNLEQCDYFKNVKLHTANERTQGSKKYIDFSLSAQYTTPQPESETTPDEKNVEKGEAK